MLKAVNQKEQQCRSFCLTVGRREGYGKGAEHSLAEIEKVIGEWLIRQRNAGEPYLPGKITAGTMLYVLRSIEEQVAEPIVSYEGEVSPEYNASRDDDDIIVALTNLAERLADELNQTRIYLRYREKILILEQND